MNESLLDCVTTDIIEVFSYLPMAFLICMGYAVLFGLVCLCVHRAGKQLSKKGLSRYFFGSTLFVIYFVVLLNTVFFSRELNSRTGTEMRLFGTWGVTMQAHAWVIENVLLFIPFGLLLPFFFPKGWNWVIMVLGFVCSVAIESIQFYTGYGFCQLDDVVMNTLGTIIGYLLYASLYKITKRREIGKRGECL